MSQLELKKRLAGLIDHTNLKPDINHASIQKLCQEALEHQFYSVCVNSSWVPDCAEILHGSEVKISAVCGFPLGANASEVKAYEAAYCVEKGASEIDMVMAVGKLKSDRDQEVVEDIRKVVQIVQDKAIVKVILETCFLTLDEIRRACRLAEQAGAHFVKTSSGFGSRGASIEDIRLMKASISEKTQIKASGGIRSWKKAWEMIEAGANRLGTSSGPAILNGLQSETEY